VRKPGVYPDKWFAARTSPMFLLNNLKYCYNNNLGAAKARLSTCNPSSTPVENIRQITPTMQNKPNFRRADIDATHLFETIYLISSARRDKKTNPIQTQSNPIKPNPKNAKNSHNLLSDRHI
jgi:hypothetical protein